MRWSILRILSQYSECVRQVQMMSVRMSDGVGTMYIRESNSLSRAIKASTLRGKRVRSVEISLLREIIC